jgi:hypothetical protein
VDRGSRSRGVPGPSRGGAVPSRTRRRTPTPVLRAHRDGRRPPHRRRCGAPDPAARPVPGLPARRRRRHGDRLLGARHRPEPCGRPEDRPPRRGSRRGTPHAGRTHRNSAARARYAGREGLRDPEVPLPPGGMGHGRHVPSGHRAGLRTRKDSRRHSLLHDALREGEPDSRLGDRRGSRWWGGGEADPPGTVPQGVRHHLLRPRPRGHPPGPEAGERGVGGVRGGRGAGLGPRQDSGGAGRGRESVAGSHPGVPRGDGPEDPRGRVGDSGIHVPGGGARGRRGRRREERCLQPRSPPLSDPHRSASVPVREFHRTGPPPEGRRASAAERIGPAGSGRDLRPVCAGPVPGSRGPSRIRRSSRPRDPGLAGPTCGGPRDRRPASGGARSARGRGRSSGGGGSPSARSCRRRLLPGDAEKARQPGRPGHPGGDRPAPGAGHRRA